MTSRIINIILFCFFTSWASSQDCPICCICGFELELIGSEVVICDPQDVDFDLTVTGGTAPYTYIWTNGQTSEDITEFVDEVGVNTYCVTVTDSGDCTGEACWSVELIEVQVNISGPDHHCEDESSDITATGSGGTAPYNYTWSGGLGTGSNVTWTDAGAYVVTATDANGCGSTAEITTTIDTIDVEIICNPADCEFCFGNSLEVSAQVTGNTSGHTYLWSNGIVSPSFTTFISGTFTVTVTDNLGCTDSAEITVTEFDNIDPIIQGDLSICPGETTNLLATTAYGSNFDYEWSSGETTADIDVDMGGEYCVTITDLITECLDSTCVTVTEFPDPSFDLGPDIEECLYTNVTLTGPANMTIYTWSNGSSGQTTSLSGPIGDNEIILDVEDANGCTASDTIIVTFLENPDVSFSAVTFCSGDQVTLTATITGGTGPYTYNWSAPVPTGQSSSSSPTFSPIGTSTGILTVTDANGCTDVTNFNLIENIVDCTDQSLEICQGESLTLTPSCTFGQSDSVEYDWSTGETSSSIDVDEDGTYTVTVTNILNSISCTDVVDIDVTVNDTVVCNAVLTDPTCDTSTNGSINLSGCGSGNTYNWSNGDIGEPLLNVGSGDYTVTVTNADNCESVQTFTLEPTCALAGGNLTFDFSPYQNLPAGQFSFVSSARIQFCGSVGASEITWGTGSASCSPVSGNDEDALIEDNTGCGGGIPTGGVVVDMTTLASDLQGCIQSNGCSSGTTVTWSASSAVMNIGGITCNCFTSLRFEVRVRERPSCTSNSTNSILAETLQENIGVACCE